MNALGGFIAIVALLLALAAASGTAQRKAGGGPKELAGLVTRSKLAANHNETLVRDTAQVPTPVTVTRIRHQ
jgi:hypothetical protein